MKGILVVIEGIDGCGSTTQTLRLAARLRERGREVVSTCEPTQGPVGELIRQALRRELVGQDGAGRRLDWATLALLFAADRLDHNHDVIEPALRAGQVVVSDRYDLSSLAYQSVTAPGGQAVLPWIRALNVRARRPDLTIVVDLDAEVAARRRHDRGGAAELFEVDELQRRLAAIYARAEDLVPDDRVVHVPGAGPEDTVARDILAVVDEVLAASSVDAT